MILFVSDKPPAPTETFIQRPFAAWSGPVGFIAAGSGRLRDLTDERPQSGTARLNALAEWATGRTLPGYDQRLTALFQAATPQALLIHYLPTALRCQPALRRTGLRAWVHVHGYDVTRHDILRRCARRVPALDAVVAGWIAPSENLRQALIALGVAAARIHLVPYGVPVPEVPPPMPEASAPPCVLQVGRLVPKKAPELTLEAFISLARSIPVAELHYAGEGPLRAALQARARAAGVGERVHFHGLVASSEVEALLRRALVLVQPSRTAPDGNQEGLPNSVLEALAAARPVIATRHAGLPEAVREGAEGWLVDAGDAAGLLAALQAACGEPAEAARRGQAAWVRARARYSLPRQVATLGQLLA